MKNLHIQEDKVMKTMIKLLLFLLCFSFLYGNENIIADEKEEKTDFFEEKSEKLDEQLSAFRRILKEKNDLALAYYHRNAPEEQIRKIWDEIKEIKKEMQDLQEQWKETYREQESEKESYAFWDQGETTLSQLVMEYGAGDYLYVIPFELGSMKLQLFSGIPIPHDSWEEMLELILSHNGIGVKTLNSFMKQLYVLKHNPGHVDAIVTSEEQLKLIPYTSVVLYVFSPPPEQAKVVQSFFERFSDLNQTTVQIVGSKVVIISSKDSIERLLEIYSAIWKENEGKMIRVVNLSKINVQEAEQVLNAFFQDGTIKGRPSFYHLPKDELIVLAQGNSLVLIGSHTLIDKAEKILQDLERQAEDPKEMTIFWYTCKHSDPEDIAAVLDQVYTSLGGLSLDLGKKKIIADKDKSKTTRGKNSPNLPVSPAAVVPGSIHDKQASESRRNFIVDPKTSSILMVVKREDLEKLKALLKKLDVPKRMVQIDVLLVEKKLQDRKKTGVNLLQIGSPSSHDKKAGISFNTGSSSKNKGILDFIWSHPGDKILPSFDLTLGFLLAQKDLQINANPSVIAINQTPATISIVEELSINNGAIPIDSSKGTTYQQSFTRAQFGITIVMTPTIHLPDDEEMTDETKGFITLQTDVTFDTTQSAENDRPPVTRRHVKNEVRIADGETIILGGLRRKSSDDEREKLPFLGEIPGIGKIFGTSKLNDSSTEMFIFITPHIIQEPMDKYKKKRMEYLKQRPGDIPLFLEKVKEAQTEERKKLFENSIELLFDKMN